MNNLFFTIALVMQVLCPLIDINAQQKINGITLVAPPIEISEQAFERVSLTNAGWICLVPFGFMKQGIPDIRYNLDRQWWGERIEGIKHCVKHAHDHHLKVMLKPQLFLGHTWIGDMEMKTEEDWISWEENYRTFIFDFLLPNIEIEMLCIGTEINKSVEQRPHFWKKLIEDLRKMYKGKLVYSSNWDQYEKISFWHDLDYVGISSYFPLTEEKTPTIGILKTKWKPILSKLKKFVKEVDRPMLFTEYGYLTIDGCAGKTWELEKKMKQAKINQKAQANSFEALYQSLSKEDWWAGGFIWKWFPEGKGHEGYPEKDYTPQDKQAEKIISDWFSRM